MSSPVHRECKELFFKLDLRVPREVRLRWTRCLEPSFDFVILVVSYASKQESCQTWDKREDSDADWTEVESSFIFLIRNSSDEMINEKL